MVFDVLANHPRPGLGRGKNRPDQACATNLIASRAYHGSSIVVSHRLKLITHTTNGPFSCFTFDNSYAGCIDNCTF